MGSEGPVRLIAKPNRLHVPPWQMVSAEVLRSDLDPSPDGSWEPLGNVSQRADVGQHLVFYICCWSKRFLHVVFLQVGAFYASKVDSDTRWR